MTEERPGKLCMKIKPKECFSMPWNSGTNRPVLWSVILSTENFSLQELLMAEIAGRTSHSTNDPMQTAVKLALQPAAPTFAHWTETKLLLLAEDYNQDCLRKTHRLYF